MSNNRQLSVTYPAAGLFIMPDKETNAYWIKQELDSFKVAVSTNEDDAHIMIRSKSRCDSMPCAMHFDFNVSSDIVAKIAEAPYYGFCWFVSGLSENNIAEIRRDVSDFDKDVVVITESVDG